MTTTLVVLAATMGNRYGGLKYLDAIGPHGETILDYSIYDAIRVGFKRIVFVINASFEQAFKETVAAKYVSRIEVDYVFQDVTDVPEEKRSSKRTMLWGSAHALLRCENKLTAPFGVINAVNFYQRESFELLYDGLQTLESSPYDAFLVGYKLGNVMPESGGANRGVCRVDEADYLLQVDELAGVERVGSHPMYHDSDNNTWVGLDEKSCVSMNMWGFTPDIFVGLRQGFARFIEKHGRDVKKAYILPDFVNELIQDGVKVKNIPTDAHWMALVSPDDKIQTLLRINELVRKGVYPSRLFATEKQ